MAYRMTPARKAALRKAQKASARRRRGKGKGKLAAANRRARRNGRIAVIAGGAALAVGAGAATYSNRDYLKKQAAKNPHIRKHMAKKLMREARARRAARG